MYDYVVRGMFIWTGHRRQGSSTEIKEDMCDVDIDIYITELTALLKLMQVRLRFVFVLFVW